MSDLLQKLESHLRSFCGDGVLLAYSGGTDSSLLLAVLCRIRETADFRFEAVMMDSVFQKTGEAEEARGTAEFSGAPFRVIGYDPLAIPELKYNPKDRCYHCKRHFFSALRKFADNNGMVHLLDGTNADDLKKYRPGKKALAELNVRSPLAECGITKAQVRELSRELRLPTAEKTASPCLATRFDYGEELTAEKIRLAETGERIVRKFSPAAKDIRLRFRKDGVSIEVSPNEIPTLKKNSGPLFHELETIGIRDPVVDPQGYRSGSFDADSAANPGK